VTLDRWTDEFVQTMVDMGNENVNAQYEAALPADFQKPVEDTPSRRAEVFIRDKYERKRYYRPTKAATRTAAPVSNTPSVVVAPTPHRAPAVDLLGGDPSPSRAQQLPPTDLMGGAAPPSSGASGDLLGGDFLASTPQASSAGDLFSVGADTNQPAAKPSGFGDFQGSPSASRGQDFGDFQGSPTPVASTSFTSGAPSHPGPSASAPPAMDASKNDILSLFNSSPATSASQVPTTGPDYRGALAGVQPQQQTFGQPGGFNNPGMQMPGGPQMGYGGFGMAPTQPQQPFGFSTGSPQQMSQGMNSGMGNMPSPQPQSQNFGFAGSAQHTGMSQSAGLSRPLQNRDVDQSKSDPFAGLAGF
jgi:Putative GTPase activating protein for Arf